LVVYLQEHEHQMWCPSPVPEGELHWRNLRSDKYKHPVGRLLEFYEGEGDAEIGPDAGGAVKSRRKTRSAVAKQSVSTATATVSAVKAAEKKKKRKRKATSPPVVVTPTIPTPRSREVESEEKDEAVEEPPVEVTRPARRSESPACKRQRELVEKTSEDALHHGLEA
jgi:hypothetical protein